MCALSLCSSEGMACQERPGSRRAQRIASLALISRPVAHDKSSVRSSVHGLGVAAASVICCLHMSSQVAALGAQPVESAKHAKTQENGQRTTKVGAPALGHAPLWPGRIAQRSRQVAPVITMLM